MAPKILIQTSLANIVIAALFACKITLYILLSINIQSLSEDDLKALSFPISPSKEYTLDDNELDEKLPLDNGWHKLSPLVNLGNLDQLPPEILSKILVQVDLQTLTDFRRANQRAMDFVDSVPQYVAIIEHTSNSIRDLLAARTAKLTSCQHLYSKLCNFRCDTCDYFGGYLYLITCKRVCYNCFTKKLFYSPLTGIEVRMEYGLTFDQLKVVPKMRSLPGCYSRAIGNVSSQFTLYDHCSALDAGIVAHRNKEAMEVHVRNVAAEHRAEYQRRLSEWTNGRGRGSRPRRPRDGLNVLDANLSHIGTRERKRFMAIVKFPHLKTSAREVDWGFRCKECQSIFGKGDDFYVRWTESSKEEIWLRAYNKETFREHLKICKSVYSGLS